MLDKTTLTLALTKFVSKENNDQVAANDQVNRNYRAFISDSDNELTAGIVEQRIGQQSHGPSHGQPRTSRPKATRGRRGGQILNSERSEAGISNRK